MLVPISYRQRWNTTNTMYRLYIFLVLPSVASIGSSFSVVEDAGSK